MRKFVVRDLVNGVLVPLNSLFDRLPMLWRQSYRLRNLRLFSTQSIGASTLLLEKDTWNEDGVLMNFGDFCEFLHGSFQVIDGEIEVIDSLNCESIVRIECFDASEWELSTDSTEVCAAITTEFGGKSENLNAS